MIRVYRIKEKRLVYAKNRMDKITYSMQKPNWAKPGFIRDLTGWDGEKLRQAREQGLVLFEKRDDGMWYDIDSIHEKFFIQKVQ